MTVGAGTALGEGRVSTAHCTQPRAGLALGTGQDREVPMLWGQAHLQS